MGPASDPAGRGNRATDTVLLYPQCGDGRLVIPIRVVRIGEVLMSFEIEGLPRRDAPMGPHRNHVTREEDRLRRITSITDNIVKRIRITVAHARQLRLAGLQVDLELE